MKIVLSRKGFDGSNGGIPSMILPDLRTVSFPIPSSDDVRYSELKLNEVTFDRIIHDLKPNFYETNCHLDPDLTQDFRTKKNDNWIPAFGQVNSSLSYLLKTAKVEVGDIFLFFGNYHFVDNTSGKYTYIKKTGDFYKDNDIQLIWGYLQIGEIITDFEEIKRKCPWHPHASESRRDCRNALFIPSDHLSFNPDMPGCGLLPYSEHRVLTERGYSKANWKKCWKDGISVYDVDNIIGEKRKNSSKTSDTVFYSGIWQELCLKENELAEEWAKEIITGKNA